MRNLIGIVFLSLQLGMVLYARFVPMRYFCWAPNDYMVEYTLEVTIDGRTLPPLESRQRYRLSDQGVYENTVTHLIGIVRQYEQTYGRRDHAQVVIRYRVNGRQEKAWRWPTE